MSFGSEVLTRPFIDRCFQDGKRVALPRVVVPLEATRHLAIYEIMDPDMNMIPGYKGILEPDASALKLVELDTIDLAVIPGVAFDKDCNRMGYGAAYYDRFLPQLRSGCLKVGVAFDLQLKDRVPVDEFDFRLDMIITEKMMYT
jgi:5-formyltetrahydrofolate cyclo-ligase